MADYPIIADVSSYIVRTLRQKMCPEPIPSPKGQLWQSGQGGIRGTMTYLHELGGSQGHRGEVNIS